MSAAPTGTQTTAPLVFDSAAELMNIINASTVEGTLGGLEEIDARLPMLATASYLRASMPAVMPTNKLAEAISHAERVWPKRSRKGTSMAASVAQSFGTLADFGNMDAERITRQALRVSSLCMKNYAAVFPQASLLRRTLLPATKVRPEDVALLGKEHEDILVIWDHVSGGLPALETITVAQLRLAHAMGRQLGLKWWSCAPGRALLEQAAVTETTTTPSTRPPGRMTQNGLHYSSASMRKT